MASKNNKLFKILMALWLAVAPMTVTMIVPVTAHSQAATFPTQPQCTVVLPATASPVSTQWINLSTPQCQDTHYFTLTFYAIGTVSTCQMKSQQAQDSIGTGASDLIANQTCTSTGVTSTSSLLAAGNTFVNINLSTKTGAGTVLGILNGYRQNPYGSLNVTTTPSSTPVPVTPNSAYLTAYNPGVTTVASGSTSTITSTTTLVQELYIENLNTAAVTVTVMDGTSNYYVGPNFSIPGLGNLNLNFGVGVVMTNGIQASAGTVSSIKLSVGGRQP